MPLPDDFDPFEHVQSIWRMIHNREVREEFSDIELDDDITTPRGSLKIACLIQDNDTAQLMDLRERLYNRVKGKDLFINSDWTEEIVPTARKPMIKLYFTEDLSAVEEGYSPIQGRIAIRLMHEADTGIMSTSEAKSYANKVKEAFGGSNGYVWRKGKQLWSYNDWAKGYRLKILSIGESEAKEVVEKLLSIQSHSPNWDLLKQNVASNPSSTFPTVPPLVTTMGKTVRLPRRRPTANVRFRYAHLQLYALKHPVLLYDKTGFFHNALID